MSIVIGKCLKNPMIQCDNNNQLKILFLTT